MSPIDAPKAPPPRDPLVGVRPLAIGVVGVVVLAAARPAAARHACLERLDKLKVPYRALERGGKLAGVEVPVEVTGPLAGVTYKTWGDKPLVLDCSLVVSLVQASRYFAEAGATEAFFSSAFQRRNVRGTDRPSRYTFGLALDLHEFAGPSLGRITLADDFEQGLGDDVDCVGQPLTAAGAILRTFFCRMDRSGLFRLVLSPDYDEDHYNHFHVEALPWAQRADRAARVSP